MNKQVSAIILLAVGLTGLAALVLYFDIGKDNNIFDNESSSVLSEDTVLSEETGIPNESHSIIGNWEGDLIYNGKSEKIKYSFDELGNAILREGNKVFGGPDFLIENIHVDVMYKIDTSKSPNHIDLLMTGIHSQTGEKVEGVFQKGIFEYVDHNTIKLCMSYADTEPQRPNEWLNTRIKGNTGVWSLKLRKQD